MSDLIKKKNNQDAFLALVRAGLWEKDVQLSAFEDIDFMGIYRLAEEQSVVGLVSAGIEHVTDVKIPQNNALIFAGSSLQLEQRNTAMNAFVKTIVEKMSSEGIYVLLVKGQGIAQCYERPLWRSSGDIDFFLDEVNFWSAKKFFDHITGTSYPLQKRDLIRKHIDYNVGSWIIELHGTLHTDLSKHIDDYLDIIQQASFINKETRIWSCSGSIIQLPSPNNDVIFIFSHILQHVFCGGIGLRQLCDLARLLWVFSSEINHQLLESRLRAMGLMSEWKVFGCVLVYYLGLPIDYMPFFDSSYLKKSRYIMSYIFDVGNFGHNRDLSYRNTFSFVLARRLKTLSRQLKDSLRLSYIFPLDGPRFLLHYIKEGTESALKEDNS